MTRWWGVALTAGLLVISAYSSWSAHEPSGGSQQGSAGLAAEGGALFQLVIFDSGLEILRAAFLPNPLPEEEADVVDLVYCEAESPTSARMLALVLPRTAEGARYRPVLAQEDCNADPVEAARRLVSLGQAPSWALVVPTLMRWAPWQVSFTAGEGGYVASAESPPDEPRYAAGRLTGRAFLPSASTAAVNLGADAADLQADIAIAFRADSLVLTGFEVGAAPPEADVVRLGHRTVPAGPVNAAFSVSNTFATRLLQAEGPRYHETGGLRFRLTPRDARASVGRLRVRAEANTEGGDQFDLVLNAEGEDLRLARVEVKPLNTDCATLPSQRRGRCHAANLARSVVASTAAQRLQVDWVDRPLHEARTAPIPVSLGPRDLQVGALVQRLSAGEAALTFYLTIGQR